MLKKKTSYIPPDSSRPYTEAQLLLRDSSRGHIGDLRNDSKIHRHYSNKTNSQEESSMLMSPMHIQAGRSDLDFKKAFIRRASPRYSMFDEQASGEKLRDQLSLMKKTKSTWNGNSHQDHSHQQHTLAKSMKHSIRKNPFNEGFQHVLPEHGGTLIHHIRQPFDSSASSHVADQTSYFNPRDMAYSVRSPTLKSLRLI